MNNDNKESITITPIITYKYNNQDFMIYEEDYEYYISKYIMNDNAYTLELCNEDELKYGDKILKDYLKKIV